MVALLCRSFRRSGMDRQMWVIPVRAGFRVSRCCVGGLSFPHPRRIRAGRPNPHHVPDQRSPIDHCSIGARATVSCSDSVRSGIGQCVLTPWRSIVCAFDAGFSGASRRERREREASEGAARSAARFIKGTHTKRYRAWMPCLLVSGVFFR